VVVAFTAYDGRGSTPLVEEEPAPLYATKTGTLLLASGGNSFLGADRTSAKRLVAPSRGVEHHQRDSGPMPATIFI
jgi:hypothetical protein